MNFNSCKINQSILTRMGLRRTHFSLKSPHLTRTTNMQQQQQKQMETGLNSLLCGFFFSTTDGSSWNK